MASALFSGDLLEALTLPIIFLNIFILCKIHFLGRTKARYDQYSIHYSGSKDGNSLRKPATGKL